MLKFPLRLYIPLLLCLMAGCTSNPNAPAKISGDVSYEGKPLPAGTISFHSEDKGVYAIQIASDGTYQLGNVPTGTMKVTIETESVNPAKKAPEYGEGKGAQMYKERLAAEGNTAAAKAPPREYRKIPVKYGDPNTTPLTVTIQSGSQVHSFALTD